MTDDIYRRTRDEQGLLPAQSTYLKKFAEVLDPKQAAKDSGISWRRIRDWLRGDTAFQTAYDQLTEGMMDAFKREVQTFADASQDTMWELLDAMKPVKVTVECRECGTKNTASVEVRDSAVRAKVAEAGMKMAGRFKDIRHHKMEGEMVHLTAGQKLALSALKMGKDISAQVYNELDEMGLIPETVKQNEPSDVIIGEGRRLE